MEKRRIQLVAGSTYSVSLPKEWVLANKLREKHDVVIYEKQDKTLVLSANPLEKMELREIDLNIDEYAQDIHQIIYAVYYLGIETITLHSKKDLTKDVKIRIRKTLARMAGTEINYEDKRKIIIKVLLDKSKVEVNQVLYRLNLLIEFSLDNMGGEANLGENEFTENEIDRLYHLLVKILSLSLIDSNTLQTSGIKNVTLIPSYFRIAKKLERIGDEIYRTCLLLRQGGSDFKHKEEIITFMKDSINRVITHLVKKPHEKFERTNEKAIADIFAKLEPVKGGEFYTYIETMLRDIVDIEEEITNILFYNRLIEEHKL